jgi:hypothetical protein
VHFDLEQHISTTERDEQQRKVEEGESECRPIDIFSPTPPQKEKREKKKEKKRQDAEREWHRIRLGCVVSNLPLAAPKDLEAEENPDLAAVMGFGGFGGGKQ